MTWVTRDPTPNKKKRALIPTKLQPQLNDFSVEFPGYPRKKFPSSASSFASCLIFRPLFILLLVMRLQKQLRRLADVPDPHQETNLILPSIKPQSLSSASTGNRQYLRTMRLSRAYPQFSCRIPNPLRPKPQQSNRSITCTPPAFFSLSRAKLCSPPSRNYSSLDIPLPATPIQPRFLMSKCT